MFALEQIHVEQVVRAMVVNLWLLWLEKYFLIEVMFNNSSCFSGANLICLFPSINDARGILNRACWETQEFHVKNVAPRSSAGQALRSFPLTSYYFHKATAPLELIPTSKAPEGRNLCNSVVSFDNQAPAGRHHLPMVQAFNW